MRKSRLGWLKVAGTFAVLIGLAILLDVFDGVGGDTGFLLGTLYGGTAGIATLFIMMIRGWVEW